MPVSVCTSVLTTSNDRSESVQGAEKVKEVDLVTVDKAIAVCPSSVSVVMVVEHSISFVTDVVLPPPAVLDGASVFANDIVNMTSREKFWMSSSFLLLSLVGCFGRSMMVNQITSFEFSLWPHARFSSIFMNASQFGTVISAAFLLFSPTATLNLFLTRILFASWPVIVCIIPLTTFSLKSHHSTPIVYTIFSVVCLIFGCYFGLLQSQAVALSGIVPRKRSQTAIAATGAPMSGILVWIVFTLCFELLFYKRSASHCRYISAVLSGLGLACWTACVLTFSYLVRIPAFVSCLKVVRVNAAAQRNAENKVEHSSWWRPRKSTIQVLQKALWPCMLVGIPGFVTFTLYPVSGPHAWPVSPSWKNVYMGVYQVLDFLCRPLPMFLPPLSLTAIKILVFGRIFFLLPFFILPIYLRTTLVISHPLWLMFCMAVIVSTHSLCMTLTMVHAMKTATTDEEVSLTAPLVALSIGFWAMIGGFLSRIPIIRYKS